MDMEDIIEAARKERWKYVDKRIPEVCDDTKVKKKALSLLNDSDGNLRDLGASIFEKAKKLKQTEITELRKVMNQDQNPYASYHAAFAIAAHVPEEYRDETLAVLRRAIKDKDVARAAKVYLEKVEKTAA